MNATRLKTPAQLAACLLSAAVLLAGVAAHATDIAERPLKASVLAKPNVIFGLDDSGSMDSELMLNTNDGAFWWDFNARNGWNASGQPWFNSAGNADSQWRKLVYLFPNGTATGDRIYADASNDHFAIPPTPQFAWLRSSAYNPLYFNPAVTYNPWSPAYVSGARRTYANASTTAARSHPVFGSSTFDLSADRALTTAANSTFMALPGMVVPAGSRTCVHSACPAWTNEAAERTVPAAGILRLAMAYFPATYWQRESCTVDGSSCVSAPDGATLRRHEIKPANYASTAAYTAALQNFSNWFSFYRKRKLMLNAAIGQVMEPLTGLRMGVVTMNSRSAVTLYDIDSTSAASNGLRVTGTFYETNGSGGTPTRETLKYIGEQYRNTSGLVQFACQRNNAFIVTDGFANATVSGDTTPPSYTAATWGAGAPYATTYASTLADIALAYFTLNLRPAMASGRVPPSGNDSNPDLHMNTYGLTLGARGTLYNGEGSALPTLASAWPNPTDNRSPTAVDDLWHATINGRGRMYLATNPQETALRIQAGLTDILSQTGAQGGIAVSTVNLPRGDSRAYFGTYNPAGWAGDLTANPIDAATGVVSTASAWSASTVLSARDWRTRVIAASTASGGVGFTAAAVGGLVNPGNDYGDSGEVMDYLRGDRSGEGTRFRLRTSLLGAIINSEPVVSREDGVVYVASGEGMLHAFDTRAPNAGREMWAFVPRFVLPDIGATVQRGYAFRTQLDGSPVIGRVAADRRLLVAGAGASARGFYALDVTAPRALDEAGVAARFRWEFPTAADTTTQGRMGQALGRPVIVRSQSDGHVVLITSGYNSTADGRGRVWMLNADTGAVIHEFNTGEGTLANEAGLTHVSAFGEPDGSVRYVYGGDLLGNVWRFDLTSKATPNKIAQLRGPAGDVQPVTTAPELVANRGQRIVVIGSGRLLDVTDFGNNAVQSIYAISDGAVLTNARSSLTARTYTRATDTLSGSSVDWASGRGWFMDLAASEHINTRPTVAYGGVAFVSNSNGGSDCSASSWLYVVDVLGGTRFAGSPGISSLISATSNSSGVTALRTSGQRIVGSGQNADGQPWNREITSGVTIDPSKNAWREVRR